MYASHPLLRDYFPVFISSPLDVQHDCIIARFVCLLQSKDNDAERFLGKVKERMDRSVPIVCIWK